LLDAQIVDCQLCEEESSQIRSTLHWCTSETRETASCSQIRLAGHTNTIFLRKEKKRKDRKLYDIEETLIFCKSFLRREWLKVGGSRPMVQGTVFASCCVYSTLIYCYSPPRGSFLENRDRFLDSIRIFEIRFASIDGNYKGKFVIVLHENCEDFKID